MVILLLILSILVTAIGALIGSRDDFGSEAIIFGSIISSIIGCIVTLAMIVFTFLAVSDVIEGKYIDEKITMYQEENSSIEKQIDSLVQDYMKYESDTLSEFKSDDSMVLVSLYPELKSDKLVQNQMSVYNDNNKKIKDLKEKKIDTKTSKWLLYFGK